MLRTPNALAVLDHIDAVFQMALARAQPAWARSASADQPGADATTDSESIPSGGLLQMADAAATVSTGSVGGDTDDVPVEIIGTQGSRSSTCV